MEFTALHIDGGTATGKDAVANGLKERLDKETGQNWEIKRGGLSKENPFTDIAQSLSTKGITHSSVYTTLAALSLYYDIRNAKTESPTILAGFNALRSAALHVDRNTKLAPLFLKLLRDSAPMIGPSFILEASLEERVRRLMARQDKQTKFDMKLIAEPQKVLRMDDMLLRLGVSYLGSERVDTNERSAKEISDLLADRYFQIINKDI